MNATVAITLAFFLAADPMTSSIAAARSERFSQPTHPETTPRESRPSSASRGLQRFTPRPSGTATRIDYGVWDDALKYFVLRMGRSIREHPQPVRAEIGTRVIYGQDSRLRLEGNRIGFSFLGSQQVAGLTAYREDLERTADVVEIASLPRNEQLAYWMNLHNVAVIEQIALAYPLQQPSRMRIGVEGDPLDRAKIVTVNGLALSAHDIRTQIVFPNWQDPRVIYGFFRGEIGGPSIAREAFNAQNIGELLDQAAYEFVNSLRGTEKRGETLHVSTIYEEAAPYFFSELNTDLASHLRQFSTDEVRSQIDRTTRVVPSIYEHDIADLAKGERDPEHSFPSRNDDPMNWGFAVTEVDSGPVGVPRNVARLVAERREKFSKLRKRGFMEGQVILLDMEELARRREADREIE